MQAFLTTHARGEAVDELVHHIEKLVSDVELLETRLCGVAWEDRGEHFVSASLFFQGTMHALPEGVLTASVACASREEACWAAARIESLYMSQP